MVTTRFGLVVVLLCGVAGAAEPTGSPADPLDVIVVAPHSDDEALGCTGVILRAIEKNRRVGIVVVTAGDGFPKAAAVVAKKEPDRLIPADFFNLASLRQRHTLQAMSQLGVRPADILFLGYPDGGMKTLYEADEQIPYRQPFTEKSETYGPAVRDYHFQVHGRPAPYVKQSVINDLAEIIRTRRPQEIYVTNEVDVHDDHRATFWLVRDAAAAAGYRGIIYTYVVHGAAPPEAPGLRLTLSETELRRKRATIEIYQAGVSPIHDHLAEKYAQPEELFWPVRVAGQ